MVFRLIVALVALIFLSGCSNFGYYTQAVFGQMELLSARRGLADVVSDEAVSEKVKARIQLAQEILAFAEDEIGLPVENTFTTYADIGRPYVVWNVFVAKSYSTKLETFCFPVAGCVGYKGFFDKNDAREFSETFQNSGFDTYLGGVAAYSSLGWFSDPLLNTFIHRSDEGLAALIFHELAHKILYVKDDTQFNESFATTVERFALQKWLESRGQDPAYVKYIEGQQRQAEVIELILQVRDKLELIYEDEKDEEEKVEEEKEEQEGVKQKHNDKSSPLMAQNKADALALLRKDYQVLHDAWLEGNEFEFWMKNDINNAKLGAIGAYQGWVSNLTHLLESSENFDAFILKAKALGKLTPSVREAALLDVRA
ncbi:MAG: putative aminopeptidase [Flavobacterium sp.]|jgi:predicted aminopeptidase